MDNCKTTVMIIAEFMCYNNHPVFLTVHSAAAIHDTNLQHTEGAFCGSPKSGDYGVDVLAKKGGRICAIQCKKFNETNPIPPKYVQQLLGGMNYYKAQNAIFVTIPPIPQMPSNKQKIVESNYGIIPFCTIMLKRIFSKKNHQKLSV